MNEVLTIQVTPDEKDLIDAIRNHNKAFPNGHKELLWYAQSLFDDLIRQ